MIVREYFADKELSCKCGCGILPPELSVNRLYALRLILRSPVYVNSAARCEKYNMAVGGESGSIHLPPIDRLGASGSWYGGAFDIDKATWEQAGISQGVLMDLAIGTGFKGIGLDKKFLHIDDADRNQITVWSY